MRGLVLACLFIPTYALAGSFVLSWDYPLDWQPRVQYRLQIVTTQAGRAVQQTQTLAAFPAGQCAQWPDTQRSPESLCSQLCLDPGDYTLTLQATTDLASDWSNVLDIDLTSTSPCHPVPVVPVPPQTKKPIPIPLVPIPLPKAPAPSSPTLTSLLNMGCVSWKVEGPCFCNPTTPCLTVSYWEPRYVVETVKSPGDTVVPLLGDVLRAVLSPTGAPVLGGGGSANASGSGHTNLSYNETHIYSLPNLFGGPCTACAPSGGFGLNYASELDAPGWRIDVSVPTPYELLLQVGTWGRLYPRSGKVIHGSPPVASALTAVRALDIMRQPIGVPPNVDAHVVTQIGDAGTPACMQMGYPRQLPCFPAGTPNALWEAGTGSLTGKFGWVIWVKRVCCVNPAMSTCGIATPGVGKTGQNVCLLPQLPSVLP
jgi:hypothetical protein